MAIKKRGQPVREFTDDQRKVAEGMVLIGVPYADIARILECSEPTLRKHLGETLEQAKKNATSKVAGHLFRTACGTGKEAVTAAIFILKTQAGWKETQVIEDRSGIEEKLAAGRARIALVEDQP